MMQCINCTWVHLNRRLTILSLICLLFLSMSSASCGMVVMIPESLSEVVCTYIGSTLVHSLNQGRCYC